MRRSEVGGKQGINFCSFKDKTLHIYLFAVLSIFAVSACTKPDQADPPPAGALPAITTIGASAVTDNSAVSGGIITNNGGLPILEKGLCVGISPSPTVANTKITATNASDTFSVTIPGLVINTTYYVRAFLSNSSGIVYGNQVSFQTSATVNYGDTAVTIYVSGGHDKKLYALNAGDGSIKWSAELAGSVLSSPIYSNGKVYVASDDAAPLSGKLYCFDTLGNLKWTVATGQIYYQCPVVGNGLVYFPDNDNLNAFNANNGALVWKFLGARGNIILKNNVIYSNPGVLYAIDAITGVKKWEYPTDSEVVPVVCDDRIYVTTGNQVDGTDFSVISRATGTELWRKNSGLTETITMNMKHGNFYRVEAWVSGTGTAGLNILDSATGNVKFPTIHFNDAEIYSDGVSPLFADSLAFIVKRLSTDAYNAFTGKLAFSLPGTKDPLLPGDAPLKGGITIVNNLVYYTQAVTSFTQNNGATYYYGFVHVFDYKTKTMKWSKEFRNGSFLIAAPCIVTKSGKVYRSGYEGQ